MAYQDFLGEFAKAHGIADKDTLLSEYKDRYSFQIGSRDRAKRMIDLLCDRTSIDFSRKSVLDVGCAYGSFAVEMANRGAQVVGIEITEKWLRLAEANARNEADITLLRCDASSREAAAQLNEYGPFDLVVLNDVLEHIYDTTGLLHNIRSLLKNSGIVYYKVPNGLATKHVLSEGHKKIFGLSLLPPDYWHLYTIAPFHIYYRRIEYFKALFQKFGFAETDILNELDDDSIDITRRHLTKDVERIRENLKRENFDNSVQYQHINKACQYYFKEIESDLGRLEWWDLFQKYRVTFWEGLLSPRPGHLALPRVPKGIKKSARKFLGPEKRRG